MHQRKRLNLLATVIAAGLLSAMSGFANAADIYCTETVTNVIVDANGGIYFETNQTCNGFWCQLSWSSPNPLNQGYAMLLSAQAQGVTLTFAWPNLANCSTANQVGASPDFISISP
jgi:hypothetical protein